MASSTTPKSVRVQFDFSAEALQQLDGLRDQLGVKSRAEVIRYSMRVMQWVIEQINNDGRLLVEHKGEVQGVVFPFLAKAVGTRVQEEAASRPLMVSR